MSMDSQIPPRPSAIKRFVPVLRSRWWTALLLLSLMLNLLIGGLVLGHGFRGGGPERLMGANNVQLVPRKFFADLPRERRRELLSIVRSNMKDLRDLRDGTSQEILALSTLLEADPIDQQKLKEQVVLVSTGAGSIASRSADITLQVINTLTPDERKLLAAAIRDRAERRQRQ